MDELSEKAYRQGQPSADDIVDRLRTKNLMAMEFINQVAGQFGLVADQDSAGRIVLSQKEPDMPKTEITHPANYKVKLYRNGVVVMEEDFKLSEMNAEDVGDAAGASIAEAVKVEEAKHRG